MFETQVLVHEWDVRFAKAETTCTSHECDVSI